MALRHASAVRVLLAATAALGLIGCQSGPTGAPALPSAVSSSPAPEPTPGPSPAEALAAALAPLKAASEFESTVTVDGAVATALRGRTLGSASTMAVTTAGRTVEYLRIPPSAWASEAGAPWLLVDSGQVPESPLAALSRPLTIAAATGAVATGLQATYPAAALGLEGDPVRVLVSIDGSVITFRYEQTSSGHQVVSTTTLRPATDTTPIEIPTPS